MKFFLLLIILLLSFTYSFGQNLMFDYAVSFKGSLNGINPLNDLKSTSDVNGNIYTAASFSGSIDLDPGPNEALYTSINTNSDIFIQKLSPTGAFLWGFNFGAIHGDDLGDIAIDSNGNVIITGTFSGGSTIYNMQIGSEVFPIIMHGLEDVFVIKISPNGDVLWVKTFGSAAREDGREVEISVNDHIILSGFYTTTMDVDPGPGVVELIGVGSLFKSFIVELDTNGEYVRKASFASTLETLIFDLSVTNEGNITIGGGYNGVLDIDPGPNVISVQGGTNTTKDILFLQLDSVFNYRWHYHFSGNAHDKITAINKDANNNIYAVGEFNGTAYFQPGIPSVSPAQNTVFLLKVDENGNLSDYKLFSGTNTEYVYSIEVDEQQNVILSVRFSDTLDVDPGVGIINIATPNESIHENCLIKLNQNLELVWYKHFTGTGQFANIEIYQNEGLLISGQVGDSLTIDPTGNYTLYNTNGGGFFAKLYEHECANMTLVAQEINSVHCDSSGYISLNTMNALAPITYQWAHLEDSSTSSITIDSAGVYSVEVTDYLGCQRGVTYVISGPENLTGFDLNANLVGGSFRTGFPTTIQIDAFNNGCTPVSGSLILTLDSLVSIDSVSIAPITIENNQLIWDLATSNMDADHFTPKVYLTVSTSAQIGDSINFQLHITPEQNDLDTTNNSKTYSFPVINGYDPNDIRINPVKKCDVNYLFLDEVHTYTIRFQNTGNAEAVNIVVIDSLSSSLDFSTFKLLGKSFDKMYISLEENNVVKFHMDSIMLLDSTTNESLSHGYIIYEISPLNSVPENTIISNKAEIYFDFNPAVITNTVSTLLVSEMNCDLNVNSIENDDNLLIYPNPVSDMLTIKISPALLSKPYSIVDQYGREISSGFFTSMEHTINLSTFSTGLYFINVEGNNKHAKIFKY